MNAAESPPDVEPSPGTWMWDTPISEVPFVFVDLEMTGLHPEDERIVEVCATRVVGVGTDGAVSNEFCTLICPDVNAGGGFEYHGLDAETLASAPTFADVAETLRAHLEGAIFVAHGARVDLAFLEASFRRIGAPYTVSHWLDTVAIARHALVQPSYNLGKLAAALGIDPGRAHRAAADVATTRALFDHLLGLLKPATPRALQRLRGAAPGGTPKPVEGASSLREDLRLACERAIAEKKALHLTYRPSRRPVISLRVMPLSLSGDRLFCHDVATFGRRELHADRILAWHWDGEEPLGIP